MNWIFQTEGTINHYKPAIHLGTQPVRVIHHMVTFMFQNSNQDFYKDLLEQIEAGKLNKELKLVFGEEPIVNIGGLMRTPRVNNDTRTIELHETFLSYLWCCTYSVFTHYIQTIDFPRVNRENGAITHPVTPKLIDEAKELFNYAKYIIIDFQTWDKETLPNPEIYEASNRNFVEQTNVYYTEAAKFILCHEFTHLKHHVDSIDNNTTDSHFLSFEIEADNNAIDIMKKGMSNDGSPLAVAHNLAVENGIVFGLLSMFYFSATTTTGVKHPNAEDRLTNALEKLDLIDNPFAWGIACVGLQLWDEQFGLNFNWTENINSYKEQYYDIINQIKARQ